MAMIDAVSIAEQVRTGRLRATDVIERALDAAIASHDTLNAFTLIDRAGARTRAEGIDRLVADGRDPGPLAGVPIALKDIINQAGLPNTKGASFPAELETESATVVRRLGNAGAVIVGRTGLHEFAYGFTSENPWFGPVRNPWDTALSPGGSSGGSAAAVASGITPVGIGTDTGGSVRVPAALCGVFGLKVTHGRVPLAGVFPLAPSLDTVGPIARTVRDLTACYLAIAGDDPSDGWSVPEPVERPTSPEHPTIGVVRQWSDVAPMSEATAKAINGFIDAARGAGCTIEFVDEPALVPPERLALAAGPEILAVHEERFSRHRERYGEDLKLRLDRCRDATTGDLLDAARWAAAARNHILRMHGTGVDVLVGPVVGGNHKLIGHDEMTIDGDTYFHREILSSFTSPINRIGVPALSAPIATAEALPHAVQLVAPMWCEHIILGVASRLERAGVLRSGQPPHWYGQIT
ncbi:MAG: amidase [Acidimicrobiia bacterium]